MQLAYNLPSLSDNKNKHIEEIKSNNPKVAKTDFNFALSC